MVLLNADCLRFDRVVCPSDPIGEELPPFGFGKLDLVQRLELGTEIGYELRLTRDW